MKMANDRYIPDSTVLITIACNIKESFDSMMDDAATAEDEELFDYLNDTLEDFLDTVKGDLLLALLMENEEKGKVNNGNES